MNHLVIFDLDGTINQTELYAVAATQKALSDLGVSNVSDEEIKSLFGACPSDYVKIYFPNGDETVFTRFLKLETEYENTLMDQYAKPFDGIQSSICALRADGYRIAVCSNSSVRYITRVLKTLHLFEYVDEIQPLLPEMTKKDTLKLLLQRTKPKKAVMIGDRVYDKEAAWENHIPFIGCGYGYNPQEIKDADRVVLSGNDIYPAVLSLIGEKKP